MKGFQNQRAPTSTILEDVLFDYTGHYLDDEAFGYSIIYPGRVSVMLLFYRDAMEQAIRKRQLQRHYRYPFLLFPPGSRIFALLMLIWSFHLFYDRSKRSHRVARYRHLVLMVEVERRNSLTIHIPYSRVTYDIRQIRLKNEALSPSARISATDLAARSPLQFNARASKEILLGSKHDWAHSRRLVDRSKRVIFTPTVYPRVVE